jgi:hypothetical protein
VFPARYELNSYIVFRKRLVSKRLRRVQKRTDILVRDAYVQDACLVAAVQGLQQHVHLWVQTTA